MSSAEEQKVALTTENKGPEVDGKKEEAQPQPQPSAVDLAAPQVACGNCSAPVTPPSPRPRSSSRSSSPQLLNAASDAGLRRALAQIRQRDLDAEHGLWLRSAGQEERWWTKQEDRYQALLARATMASTSARDMLNHLRRSCRLLQSVSEQLGALGSFGVPPGGGSSSSPGSGSAPGGAGESGSMRVACMSIDIVRKSTSSYLAELNHRVLGESLKRAHATSDAADKLLHSVSGTGNDALRGLRAARKSTWDAWHAYVRAGEERSRAFEAAQTPASAGLKVKSDPFLLARAYEAERHALDTAEAKFSAVMATLLRELEAQETQRLAHSKHTLLDSLAAQKAVLEHAVKFTSEALETVRAIDPEADVRQFAADAELYLNAREAKEVAQSQQQASANLLPRNLPPSEEASLAAHVQTSQATAAAAEAAQAAPIASFQAPAPARDSAALQRVYAHEVEKEGSLWRQGAIVRSHWKPVAAVCSASGFLHLFDDKDRQSGERSPGGSSVTGGAALAKRSPHSSYALSDATLEEAGSVHPHAFALRFQRSGFSFGSGSSYVYLRANSDDEAMEWQVAMAKHCARAEKPRSDSASPRAQEPAAAEAQQPEAQEHAPQSS